MAAAAHYEEACRFHIVSRGARVKRPIEGDIREQIFSGYSGGKNSNALNNVIQRGSRLLDLVKVAGVAALTSQRIANAIIDSSQERAAIFYDILKASGLVERWEVVSSEATGIDPSNLDQCLGAAIQDFRERYEVYFLLAFRVTY